MKKFYLTIQRKAYFKIFLFFKCTVCCIFLQEQNCQIVFTLIYKANRKVDKCITVFSNGIYLLARNDKTSVQIVQRANSHHILRVAVIFEMQQREFLPRSNSPRMDSSWKPYHDVFSRLSNTAFT